MTALDTIGLWEGELWIAVSEDGFEPEPFVAARSDEGCEGAERGWRATRDNEPFEDTGATLARMRARVRLAVYTERDGDADPPPAEVLSAAEDLARVHAAALDAARRVGCAVVGMEERSTCEVLALIEDRQGEVMALREECESSQALLASVREACDDTLCPNDSTMAEHITRLYEDGESFAIRAFAAEQERDAARAELAALRAAVEGLAAKHDEAAAQHEAQAFGEEAADETSAGRRRAYPHRVVAGYERSLAASLRALLAAAGGGR